MLEPGVLCLFQRILAWSHLSREPQGSLLLLSNVSCDRQSKCQWVEQATLPQLHSSYCAAQDPSDLQPAQCHSFKLPVGPKEQGSEVEFPPVCSTLSKPLLGILPLACCHCE